MRINDEKLKQAIHNLEHALSFEGRIAEDGFYFSGIAKNFESCLEYAWKYFKRMAQKEGIEPYSPRDAIKAAGKIGLIDDVEKWFDFLDDRNDAVHDYMGISDEDYLKTIKEFLKEVKKLDLITSLT